MITRFTPTHVGQISSAVSTEADPMRFTPTHVGQMLALFILRCLLLGSPPRMWGRCHRVTFSDIACQRFTPTHVGQM